jgi:hypothetical protein
MTEEFEKSASLTFSNENVPDETFQDDETVLLTINMSFHQKASIKELRKKILHSVKKNEFFDEMLEADNYKLSKYTMFYLMFQNLIEYVLEDCEDKEFVQSVVDSMLFTEQLEVLSNLSERKFDFNNNTEMSIAEVKRIPSNYSMSLCKCCISPEQTSNINDFSRDTFISKQKNK